MENRQFNDAIRQLRSEQLPSCPFWIEGTVVSRVRAEARNREGLAFSALALRPRMLAAILAMTVSLGAVTTTVASQVAPPRTKIVEPMGFELISNPHILECHPVPGGSRGGHHTHGRR